MIEENDVIDYVTKTHLISNTLFKQLKRCTYTIILDFWYISGNQNDITLKETSSIRA